LRALYVGWSNEEQGLEKTRWERERLDEGWSSEKA